MKKQRLLRQDIRRLYNEIILCYERCENLNNYDYALKGSFHKLFVIKLIVNNYFEENIVDYETNIIDYYQFRIRNLAIRFLVTLIDNYTIIDE